MVRRGAIAIKGYKGRQVANAFYRQQAQTDYLAILFAGWHYSADMPLLYFTRKILSGLGADVLTVDFNYSADERYARLSDEQRREWFLSDVRSAYRQALRGRGYERLLLVGMSFGTMAVADLVIEGLFDDAARLVWISPLLNAESIRTTLAEGTHRSLVVIGTQDESFSEENVRLVRRNTSLEMMVVEHGDANIEAEADATRSAELVVAYVNRLKAFLGLVPEPSDRPADRGEAAWRD